MVAKGMRKLVPFLVCLMLVLTAWAGTAHAAEALGIETSQVDRTVHAAGDGDEVPADADKGYPHHHSSCHEHQVNTPVLRADAIAIAVPPALPPVARSRALSGRETDTALRPPQA